MRVANQVLPEEMTVQLWFVVCKHVLHHVEDVDWRVGKEFKPLSAPVDDDSHDHFKRDKRGVFKEPCKGRYEKKTGEK